MTYDERCERAARDQGLEPALRMLGRVFDDVTVEQTGGFCMAVRVPCRVGYVLVTRDGCWPGTYLVGYYPDDESDGGNVSHRSFERLAEAVNMFVS